MRKTKILCTIGPVSESYDMLSKMVDAGMNAVRLNMSHGNHQSHSQVIKSVKTLNKKIKYPIPILLDTQGPEIRTGNLDRDLELKNGDVITVSVRAGNVEESSIHINYEDLIDTVSVDDIITVDNGLINLQVLNKQQQQMRCKVIDGGLLKSKRHVNLPGIRVNLPAITAKDREDILFGIEQEVDFIALSFVRQADDVKKLKELMADKQHKIKIIAKIEDQEGVKNIDEILEEVDGIMVARGDLGVEIQVEELPNVQRTIVKKCHQKGKRCIVATHLLESMIENPIPTRAEVTDVANAIYEEVDGIMLSGETTIGKYPIKCIEYLDKIARTSEKEEGLRFCRHLIKSNDKQHLAFSAVELATSLQAAGIVVITRRGVMAGYVANCRPFKTPIYAFTNDSRTRRILSLTQNAVPNMMTFSNDPEKTLGNAFATLKEKEGFVGGEKVVVISDVIAGAGVDAIQIRYVPE